MKRIRKRKSKKGLILVALFLFAAGSAAAYIYMSPKFEREAPRVYVPKKLYYNGKKPLSIVIEDNEGIRMFDAALFVGGKTVPLLSEHFENKPKKRTIALRLPKGLPDGEYTLRLAVEDTSLWHMMRGNRVEKSVKITVDTKRPNVNIVANSRSVAQGGSALVVFYANDAHLKNLYVQVNGHRFKAQPYKKDGYYAALIAWPFNEERFEAQVVAEDEAGNIRRSHIPFYHKNPKYRTSYIRARDSFINGKISDLASADPEYADITDPLEKLRAINEKMRAKNEALIHKITSHVSDELIKSWHIAAFRPLKNGKKVADFGDHRYYYYGDKNNIVSESYHLGYDLASVKMADIVAANPGKVVFADENGIYGNMPIIDHGLGLYTLYGHCSVLKVKKGDRVKAGETIARTGMTGLALGDHLHFGVLVQGVEVRPVEWFDKRWIRTFITNVFDTADKIIEGKRQ